MKHTSASPELLLIDISNSRTKIASANYDALTAERATLPTKDLSATAFSDIPLGSRRRAHHPRLGRP